MDVNPSAFADKSPRFEKLTEYGFERRANCYFYCRKICGGQFDLHITVEEDGRITAALFDCDLNEEYTLHLVKQSAGEFVGRVRAEYESALEDIAEKCFYGDVFRSAQSKAVMRYVLDKYGDAPEFLWEKLPDAAVLRRKDKGKWYAVFMKVPLDKFIPSAEGVAEIADLRVNPDDMQTLTKSAGIFVGYHMNKKHWISVVLDGSVPIEKIYALIDYSYSKAL